MLEEIVHNGKLISILVKHNFVSEGIKFFTPPTFSQQLAYMAHKKGHVIAAHYHNRVPREVEYTQEVLFVRSGKVKVDFYDDSGTWIDARILDPGDVILLASGGHGFEIMEDAEMIEVKQGPYSGTVDKTHIACNAKAK